MFEVTLESTKQIWIYIIPMLAGILDDQLIYSYTRPAYCWLDA